MVYALVTAAPDGSPWEVKEARADPAAPSPAWGKTMSLFTLPRSPKGPATARRVAFLLGAVLIPIPEAGSARAATYKAASVGALVDSINSANRPGGSHTIIGNDARALKRRAE